MELLTEKSTQVFDLEVIKVGMLIYAKHESWETAIAGIIADLAEDQLRVQYVPDAGGLSNYFTIYPSEIAGGRWKIRWSQDMSVIYEVGDGLWS